MKFTITKDALLKPLQLVSGAIESRQTLPILSHVLLETSKKQLIMTGTDLEVELIGKIELDQPAIEARTTVPARKWLDICKSLPEGAVIEFALEQNKAILRAGKSRFSLLTLPAADFPNIDKKSGDWEITLQQSQLRYLLERTGFAMAQQDVRYYLNGLLLEATPSSLTAVATDGHRLALSRLAIATAVEQKLQVILPRKGVLELTRLLSATEEPVKLSLSSHYLYASFPGVSFTSKLIDGKFPDYNGVIPKKGSKEVVANRQELRQALGRVAILANEKHHGVRLQLASGVLQLTANNPEQEEAAEEVVVDYQGESLEIGFNAAYLLDILTILKGDSAKVTFADANSSVLIEDAEKDASIYVVMPMRL